VLGNFLTSSRPAACEPSDGPPLEFVFCNVAEPFDVAGGVDLVMHLASPASPADYARYPLQTLNSGSLGTRNALELAARKGARFVLASTPEVYGDPQVSPQREDYHGNVNPIGPRGVYDEASDRTMAGWCPRSPARHCAASRSLSTATGRRPARCATPTTPCAGCYYWPPATWPARLTSATRTRPRSARSPPGSSPSPGRLPPFATCPGPPDDAMSRKPDITLARTMLGFEPRIGWHAGLTDTVAWFRQALAGPEVTMPYLNGRSAARIATAIARLS
jgi:dTDP-glucose 4,6-dehydratase